jgi:ribosomal protein L37AE/L43A
VLTQASPARQIVAAYDGPRCPRCDQKLTSDWIRSGTITCPDCGRTFEATAFQPPAPALRVAEVATAGPASANACANHVRNAATTNCTRCGLFICALCDMNVGSGSYCPACFERMRSDGALPTGRKGRDYASMARISAIVGILFAFLFVGPLFGILSMYYNSRARKDRMKAGETPAWTGGMIVVEILAVLVLIGGALMDVVLVWGLIQHK